MTTIKGTVGGDDFTVTFGDTEIDDDGTGWAVASAQRHLGELVKINPTEYAPMARKAPWTLLPGVIDALSWMGPVKARYVGTVPNAPMSTAPEGAVF